MSIFLLGRIFTYIAFVYRSPSSLGIWVTFKSRTSFTPVGVAIIFNSFSSPYECTTEPWLVRELYLLELSLQNIYFEQDKIKINTKMLNDNTRNKILLYVWIFSVNLNLIQPRNLGKNGFNNVQQILFFLWMYGNLKIARY